jgi:MoaA/NifB/PqqE/SkfB family radical SAM enzyme
MINLKSILNKKDMTKQFDHIDDSHTKRCKINTGHICNANCPFCYYSNSRIENIKFDLIEKQLGIAKKFGMESVDFSGGEPTIHKDFKKMIETANKIGFKDICAVTNGLTFHDKGFMKECMELGLNDILLSLHGIEPIQNRVMGIDNAYSRAIKTIENANDLGLRVRVNSVVSSMTYKNLPLLSKELNVYNYNMILFKYCFDQINSPDFVNHLKTSQYIKQAIDNCKDRIEVINVRYIPFCFMRGYEKYVTNFHQKKYDPLEWNNALFFRFEHIENICLDFLDNDPEEENNRAIEQYSVSDYCKANNCIRCRDFLICDGFETAYKDLEEAKPEPGKKIKDPLYYRRDR